MIYDMIRYI